MQHLHKSAYNVSRLLYSYLVICIRVTYYIAYNYLGFFIRILFLLIGSSVSRHISLPISSSYTFPPVSPSDYFHDIMDVDLMPYAFTEDICNKLNGRTQLELTPPLHISITTQCYYNIT